MSFVPTSCNKRRGRLWGGLGTLALLGACASPPAASVVPAPPGTSVFAIEASVASAPPTASPTPLPAEPTGPQDPPATPGPDGSPSAPASGGGGTGGSGGGTPSSPLPESYFLLPNGTRVPAAASDAVTLPADLMGEASLFLPGRVPSTLVIGAGDTVPPETHPAPNTSVARPFTSGMVTGSLVGLEGNVVVRFEEPSRLSQAATTSAVGQPFSLTVPAASPTTGLLIANDTDSTPRLAIKQLTVLPGETVDAGDLTLEISTGEALAPAAPAGMTPTGASLLLVDAGRLLPILSVLGGRLPTYTLPGVTTVHSFQAASQDGERFSRTSGAAGLVPAFLEAPSLAGLPARLRAGTRLSWPGVPGATLYTLRLAERTNAGPPLWEGATTGTQVTVPGDLALGGRSLELWVDAWDAQEVSLFSVAAARMLRVPQEPNAPVGRHSSAVRRYFP